MSKDIEPKIRVEDIEHVGKIELGEWGLEIKEALTTKDWLDAVINLQKFDGKVQWYLGDLVAYATSDLVGWDSNGKSGESKYENLIKATGYDYQTLANYASVARKFPHEQREIFLKSLPLAVNISFSHFQEVKGLDENFAYYFLQKANDNGWGKSRLREEIRKWKESRGEIEEPREEPVSFKTFREQGKKAWKGYVPMARDNFEYDETSYWLEIRDYASEQLKRLGVEDV